jgi:tRNA 2-thiouridine synthesizing protein A
MAGRKADAAGGAVYLVSTSSVGQGAPDLGEAIMKSLMTTLTQQQTPAALIFVNSGVHLTVGGSPVLEQLKTLAAAGTEILVCSACLNYYKLAEKLAVGVVANMDGINSRMNGTEKVISIA